MRQQQHITSPLYISLFTFVSLVTDSKQVSELAINPISIIQNIILQAINSLPSVLLFSLGSVRCEFDSVGLAEQGFSRPSFIPNIESLNMPSAAA